MLSLKKSNNIEFSKGPDIGSPLGCDFSHNPKCSRQAPCYKIHMGEDGIFTVCYICAERLKTKGGRIIKRF
jgi:hypothetical protein